MKLSPKDLLIGWANWLGVRWRAGVVLAVFALCGLIILGRAVQLQVTDRAFYAKQGGDRHERLRSIAAHRGVITDRNGAPLAISVPLVAIFADPKILSDYPDRIEELAELLDRDAEQLYDLIMADPERRFVYLKRHAQQRFAMQVQEAGIPGVGFKREYRRFYPTADVAAPLLGFSDIDDQGQAGLELAYDHVLSSEVGQRRILQDANGREIADLGVVKEAIPGKNLQLSIDRRLQYLSYQALIKGIGEHQASSGAAILMDVNTGEVLAMASAPSFNPNNRATIDPQTSRNRAIVDQFEPGSTVKPFTVAAALETGNWHPEDEIDTNPGSVRVGGFTIKDLRNYGVIDLNELLMRSSNVASTILARDMGAEHLWRTYRALGFGQYSGVGFPGEAPGSLSLWHDWRPADLAAHSYGYGLSVNLLQLATAYATLGNQGKAVSPTLIIRDHTPEGEQVFSPEVANTVVQLMESAVSPTGTARRAGIDDYYVAAKTGTVRRLSPQGGYASDSYNTIFVGMAPASDPRLVLAIWMTDPQTRPPYAGQIVAPVFQEIMSGALRMLNVRPDELDKRYRAQMLSERPRIAPRSEPKLAEQVNDLAGSVINVGGER
ncbi:MAG TPA: penicillin-binding protein 2 [Halothiobacillaceae bacterium]|nr:penicillin-binding protein 2 [Halothiobacillaceae bacterium]